MADRSSAQAPSALGVSCRLSPFCGLMAGLAVFVALVPQPFFALAASGVAAEAGATPDGDGGPPVSSPAATIKGLEISPELEPHNRPPPEVRNVKVSERIGTRLNLELGFRDHTGQEVRLGDFFDGQTPVLLSLNYYDCATLCTLQLNAYASAMSRMDWLPGREFKVVTVSINPENSPEIATLKRESYLEELDREGAAWNFLLDDKNAVKELADSLGFEYAYDPRTGQYAHAAVTYAITPSGNISRYLYGISPSVRDLKFALMESSEGKLGTTIERFVMNCFHFDDLTGRYTPFAMGTMRWGGAATALGLGLWLRALWSRDKRKRLGERFA